MPTLCLFVHHDSDDQYSSDDLRYIKTLLSIFKTVIVLTSNTHPVVNIDVQTVYNIPNRGVDFGKLEYYMTYYDITQYDSLYFVNNSCLLLRDPMISIQHMMRKQFDFWGYTSSTEVQYHIQSYFLYFNQKAIRVLKDLILTVKPFTKNLGRQQVINEIELQLYNRMVENNLRGGTYTKTHLTFPNTNAIIYFSESLLNLNPHFPLVKKSLLIDNTIREYFIRLGTSD